MIIKYELNIIFILIVFLFLLYSCETKNKELVALEFPKKISVDIGKSTEILFKVYVSEGYHVQANPASDEFLIPTSIDNIIIKDAIVGNPIYPEGKPFTLEGSDSPISVYDGVIDIKIPISLPLNAKQEISNLTGEFKYQMCDLVRCYVPKSILFSISVKKIRS